MPHTEGPSPLPATGARFPSPVGPSRRNRHRCSVTRQASQRHPTIVTTVRNPVALPPASLPRESCDCPPEPASALRRVSSPRVTLRHKGGAALCSDEHFSYASRRPARAHSGTRRSQGLDPVLSVTYARPTAARPFHSVKRSCTEGGTTMYARYEGPEPALTVRGRQPCPAARSPPARPRATARRR